MATARLPAFLADASALVEAAQGRRLSLSGDGGDGKGCVIVAAPEGVAPVSSTSSFARAMSPRRSDLAVALGGAFGASYGIDFVDLDHCRASAKCDVMSAVKAMRVQKGVMISGKVL